MTPSFIHLHLHSEYSLADSTIRIAQLVQAAADAGMPAVAITDECNLFALVKFYQAAETAGVKPIIGCDLWVSDDEHAPFRVTVLCKNHQGYQDLSRILSAAYRARAHGKPPCVERIWLEQNAQDLFVLLGQHSDVGTHIVAGNDDTAFENLQRWMQHFNDHVYLELVRTGRAEEERFVRHASTLAASLHCGAIASNDVRFLQREDFDAHEARVCIHSGQQLADPRRTRSYSADQYLRTPQEMAELFADLPEALINTVELAKRCNVELKFGVYHLPNFPIPADHDLKSFLFHSAREGLEKRIKQYPPAARYSRDDYDQRLNTELEVIISMGFAGYFLIVADFISWAKNNDVPVGPGRGSGAGSLVAYALGITDPDPLQYDLLFERFLNPERVSMPDFDIDFCMDGRDRVIRYVEQKYGHEKVCQIITYGSMAAKAVVRDCGRVLGMGYNNVDSIAKLIPLQLGICLDDAIKQSSELRERIDSEEEVAQLIKLALQLEDLKRNAGTHAGGVVIAPDDLTLFSPLYCEAMGEGVVTQFDKDDVETVGLVKFDFLGLRTLTIIDWAVKAANKKRLSNGEAPIDIATLPLDDKATYALLKSHRTTAVFQLESTGMKDLIRKLQPAEFEDIVALVALYRPGPLKSGMVDDFVARKHGRAAVAYPHPALEKLLKPTYGVVVYQEQVMQIAQVLAGYSLGSADLLRRAMGKKKAEEMAKQRSIFEAGAEKQGISVHTASHIFDLMEKFGEYGFNKSHSVAYALIAYQTAWLKAHYPAEFLAAVLSSDMDNTDKVVAFLSDAREFGLDILPPDVNQSKYQFTALDDGRIRYGLGAIKGAGQAACSAIAEECEAHGPFKNLLDLCQRVELSKLNKRVLEALILSGAMDGLAETRATLMVQLPEVMRACDQRQRDMDAGQNDLFGGGSAAPIKLEFASLPEWPVAQKLNGERETLGHFISGHPTDSCKDFLAQLTTVQISRAEEHYKAPVANERSYRQETTIVLGGLVLNMRRKGDNMAFVQLEDHSGRIEVGFFREPCQEYGHLLIRDQILIIEVGISHDDFSNGMQAKAKRVWTLESAIESNARKISLQLNGVGEAFTTALRQSLSPFVPGSTALQLHYANASAQTELELGEKWKLRVSTELIDKLRQLPGVVKAELILGRAGANSGN